MDEDFDPDEEGADEAFVPEDDPMAADDAGVTAEEQLRGAGLERRLREEQPDRPTRPRRDDVGQLSAEGDTEPDEEKDLVATEEPEAPGTESAEEEAVREVPEERVPGAVDDPGDEYLENNGT